MFPRTWRTLSLCLLLSVFQPALGQTAALKIQGKPQAKAQKPAGAPASDSGAGGAVLVGSYSLTETADLGPITIVLPADLQSHVLQSHVLVKGTSYSFSIDPSPSSTVTVISGRATVVKTGAGTFVVTPTQTGPLVLEASKFREDTKENVKGTTPVLAARVDVTFMVAENADEEASLRVCDVLFPSLASTPRTVDAAALIHLIGDTTPFKLKAAGKREILVYASSEQSGTLALNDLNNKLKQLESLAISLPADAIEPHPFSVEISIRHSSALGDLATRFGSINPDTFTVANVSPDTIRVSSATQPDCDTWKAFLRDVRHAVFGINAEPPSMRLYYLSASNVSAAFGAAKESAKSPSDTASGAAAKSQDDGTKPAQNEKTAPSGNEGNATGTPQPAAGSGKGTSTTTVTIGAGTTTITSTNSSGTADGGSNAKAPAASKVGDNSTSTATKTSPAATAKAPLTITPLESDILLFPDASPTDDSTVKEKKRILALLDLPRPEMLINAWVMQNSTGDPKTAGQFTSLVREIVNQHNYFLQRTIFLGYESIKKQLAKDPAGYFNEPFYKYVTRRYIARDLDSTEKTPAISYSADNYVAGRLRPKTGHEDHLDEYGICPPNVYCLGYSTLFQPMRPRLTDVLLAIIASKTPLETADKAIDAAERWLEPSPRHKCKKKPFAPTDKKYIQEAKEAACNDMFLLVDLDRVPQEDSDRLPCDRKDLYHEIEIGGDSYASQIYPNVQLECFREEMHLLFKEKRCSSACTEPQETKPKEEANTQPSAEGLLRAAIADFLFNYKMSQQYPHEFAAYDLSISADTLNTALSPLVDAFNRDVAAYQVYLRAVVENEVQRINKRAGRSPFEKVLGLDKPGFTNNGLVTVRTVSGQEAKVDTVSQSYLDASTAPQLSQVASDALAALTGTTSTGTSKSGAAQSAANAASNLMTPQAEKIAEASLAVLKNYQSSEAQIGRAIKLDVTPRSLVGASAAEINVSFNVADSANPTYYSSGPENGKIVDISRVATHDITTHVRVDSVKLFEISSITAVLQRPRPKFPLLPPFVEIPYIGTFAGIPLPAAKEYHNSTAVLSAVVVPTAADLAYGLKFASDKIVDPDLDLQKCRWPWEGTADVKVSPCKVRNAESVRDLDDLPIKEFNRVMVHCIATEGLQAFSSLVSLDPSTSGQQCTNTNLKLTNVLTDAH